jgi:hypothetical protein
MTATTNVSARTDPRIDPTLRLFNFGFEFIAASLKKRERLFSRVGRRPRTIRGVRASVRIG